MADVAQKQLNFFQVAGGGDDKFQLEWVAGYPFPDDGRLPAELFVLLLPGSRQSLVGRGIAEFGAERSQVAGNALGRDGGGGFDGDVLASCAKCSRKFADALGNHRFATGEHAVGRGVRQYVGNDLIHRHFRAFWVPGGIHGIAPVAPEITARCANEDGRDAGEFPFALNRIKNLGNEHQFCTGLGGRGARLK